MTCSFAARGSIADLLRKATVTLQEFQFTPRFLYAGVLRYPANLASRLSTTKGERIETPGG